MTDHASRLATVAALLATLAAAPALAQDQDVGDWLEDGEGVPTQEGLNDIDSPGFGDDVGIGAAPDLPGEETLDADTPLSEGEGAAPGPGGDGATGLFDEAEFDNTGDSLGDVELYDDDVDDAEPYGDAEGPLDGVGDGGVMDDGAGGLGDL